MKNKILKTKKIVQLPALVLCPVLNLAPTPFQFLSALSF